ncbi:O-antigen ligase [Paenibacillus sp. PAMC21692]|uniref:O-antigen ligase family protein n=1 Tax=Paenibacillus sp. PAMC21692 TaxID=2762320 RepID=UPI00164DA011|nr:O-antigen ligase family protein [Paenibacillus sp. PAMC21692]QNK58173.1 O-antigen ligase family protein [Paenibacillus sp. PAMC21692]
MLSYENIKLWILYLVIVVVTLLPASINTNISYIIGNNHYRLNVIIVSVIFMMILVKKTAKYISHYREISLNKYEILYVFFLFYALIFGLINSFDSVNRLSSVISTFLIISIPFLLYKLILSIRSKSKSVVNFFILIGNLVSSQVVFFSLFFYQLAPRMGWDISSYTNAEFVRVSTTVGSATVTGLFLFFIFVISLLQSRESNGYYYKFSMYYTCIAILLTSTRSAILLLLMFLVLVNVRNFKENIGKWIKGLLISIAFITIVNVVLPETTDRILSRFLTDSSINSNNKRDELLRISIENFKHNPILGSGIGLGYKRLDNMSPTNAAMENPHNQHTALLLEMGLLGYIIFSIFIFQLIQSFRTYYNIEYVRYLVVAVLSLIYFGGLFETFYTSDIRTSIIIWVGIALAKIKIDLRTDKEV